MIVKAEFLNASDVHVLLPKMFDVGICEGHCKKLQSTSNTDHASILALYYQNNVDLIDVPSKCCVPASYKKINMLFYNTTIGEHILKPKVAVQADSCICL